MASAFLGSASGESAKPNIVVLYADDWRFDTLGCAGNPIVKTPNLDALANKGVRFTQNCVTTSICGVSRASLFTGQWMSRHGNRAFRPFDTPWEETYPGMLRDNGYWVGHIGKWHNGKFPAEKYDYGTAYSGTHWVAAPDGGKIHVTEKNGNDAMEFLSKRPQDKPFVLTLAFFAPHAEDHNPKQFLPQPESMGLYSDITIPVPKTAAAAWEKLPPFFDAENEGRNRWTWRFDEPGKYQEMMKNYYRLATEVDAVCGKVIAELKRQGIYDNTLVIFTTDNGYYHGEHGLADKWYPHQESIRVPLIIDDPRMPANARGTVDDNITLNVDLAPTILAFAGIEVPETMQGRDISDLYVGMVGAEGWRDEFFYEHPTLNNKDFIPASEALVRKDWKYFFWPEHGVEQLFHITADPFEENDLINDPLQKERIAEMRARFNELKAQAK